MNLNLYSARLRRLCIGIVVAAGAEFVIATTGVQIGDLPPSTDFASYYLAGAQTRDHLSPYDRGAIAARGHALGFAHDQFPFLYPPPFALAMQPLARLSYPRARQLWLLLCTVDIGLALAVTGSLLRRQAAALSLSENRYVWILFAAFVPAALNSTSVHNDLRAGSVGVLLYMMLAVATLQFLQMSRRRELGSPPSWAGSLILGAALAIATLAKLTPVFLLPYVFWRGARRGAGVAVLLLAVSMLPAVVHWGPGIVTDYMQNAILPSVHDEVAPPMNQSLDAYLSRLLVPSAVVAAPFDAPNLKRVLSVLLALGIVAVTLRALARRARAASLLPIEMGLVMLAILMLMKLTWVHTLAAILFVWPCLMLAVLRAAERGALWARRAGVGACIGFFLSSAHIPILWERLRHGPWVLFTGFHLAGLIVLWATCAWVLEHQEEIVDLPARGANVRSTRDAVLQP